MEIPVRQNSGTRDRYFSLNYDPQVAAEKRSHPKLYMNRIESELGLLAFWDALDLDMLPTEQLRTALDSVNERLHCSLHLENFYNEFCELRNGMNKRQ